MLTWHRSTPCQRHRSRANGDDMTTQRQAGIFLSVFSAVVVINHWVHSELSMYDLVYSILASPLILTIIFESIAYKWFQVFIISFVGVLMVYAGGDSIYLGVVIMAMAYLFAYTYGFLETYARAKSLVMVAVFTVTVFLATGLDPLRTLTWMMMCAVVLWAFWINAKHLVGKAKKAEELAKKSLEQSLAMSEALLEETVKAGMVLVDEIKSKDGGNGSN